MREGATQPRSLQTFSQPRIEEPGKWFHATKPARVLLVTSFRDNIPLECVAGFSGLTGDRTKRARLNNP